jgi:hypothetical protein
MIIIRLKGGLGNQLFQYSAGRQLSIKQNVPLKFDFSFLDAEPTNYTKRYLELDKFNINIETASEKEIKIIRRQRWRNIFVPTWIKERETDCYDKFSRAGKNCYLDGYFQSEKYFINISEQIRNELIFRDSLLNEDWAEKKYIKFSNSVSLHFRRSDYVSNLNANQVHGVCSMDYYQKAIRMIVEKVENPQFFIFSDDIQWVMQNFKTDYPSVFVEKKDENLHSDFQLMSLCKHNIIANSSYSWWAAWLNKNENKIVIAPEKWYANKKKQSKIGNLLPEKWLKL